VPKPTAEFCQTWHDKVIEIIDAYHPDLIYFDSRAAIIDESARLKFLAYFYNQAQKEGREVVMTYKNEDFAKGSGVVDLECGRMADITPFKWQTDDDMDWNSWAYLESPNYKPATRLIQQLVDIVSKNGNLLLNICPRPDGTIPEPIRESLLGLGRWLDVNGEAIYGTRPWEIYGEGPLQIKEGSFGERKDQAATAADIRFTKKGNALYAICLGVPAGEVRIKALGKSPGRGDKPIVNVKLLGSYESLNWSQEADALVIQRLRRIPSLHAVAFKINFKE
jgi:alpha-L-fucosidase